MPPLTRLDSPVIVSGNTTISITVSLLCEFGIYRSVSSTGGQDPWLSVLTVLSQSPVQCQMKVQ